VSNVRCDHTSVLRWLAGEQPRSPVPELAAVVLSDALGRKVSETELGMTPSDLPGDLGLQLPTGWTETIATSTALWRADVQRRRFLVNAVFTSAALPASALRWLTSPPAAAPAVFGARKVGRADIDSIRELTHSYREMDNRLGGGPSGTSPRPWPTRGTLVTMHLRRRFSPPMRTRRSTWPGQMRRSTSPEPPRPLPSGTGSATLLTECLVMEAHGHAARNDAHACGTTLARAEQTFDRAAREDDPAWLAYFDEAYLAARMAQCFRDLGEAGHAARYARRSLDMDGRYVRGRAFNLSLLATAYATQCEPEQASVVGRQVRERLPAAAGHAAPR
jgi:hypothetical protein